MPVLPHSLPRRQGARTASLPQSAPRATLHGLALEEAAMHALQAGIAQIAILDGSAAALTARLLRQYPDARIAALDPHCPDIRDALVSQPGFRIRDPAFFLGPDALLGLDRGGAENLFSQLAKLPCAAVRIAFVFREPLAKRGAFGRGLARAKALCMSVGTSVAMNMGMDISLGANGGRQAAHWTLPAREMRAFLARLGFALEEIADAKVLASRFWKNGEVCPAAGEMVAIATSMPR